MQCEKCGNKPAVMKIYENINGEEKTRYICEDCAMEMMGSHLSFGGIDPFAIFPSFSGANRRQTTADITCPSCGMTFRRFLDLGKFGCADCYDAFGDQLKPVFKKLQFNTEYKGKVPAGSPVRLKKEPVKAPPTELWQQEIAAAVAREDYERAAELKKKIENYQKEGEETP